MDCRVCCNWPIEVVDLALQLQELGLADHPTLGERRHDAQFLAGEAQGFGILPLAGPQLVQLLRALLLLPPEDFDLAAERLLARGEEPALGGDQVGRRHAELLGKCGLATLDLGLEPRQGRFEREVARAPLAEIGRGADVVDPHQGLPLLDDLALADHDVGDDAALEVLHDLGLARRDHPALAPGHLLERRPAGPAEEHHEKRDDDKEKDMGQPLRAEVLDAVAADCRCRHQRVAAGQSQLPLGRLQHFNWPP
jgi:hypothetical protein